MGRFDIEHFPTSPSAVRMMNTITKNGWYDRSYVGKWIFQVMGLSLDEVAALIQSMYQEAFPETCTWTIAWWERKYGLPVRENLPLEKRRKLVITQRDAHTPISPYRMERIIGGLIDDIEVHVADINDPGPYGWAAPHPNVFKVYFLADAVDIGAVRRILNKWKQSHTTYFLNWRTELVMDERKEERMILSLAHRLKVPFWGGTMYNGARYYDGQMLYNAARRYGLGLGTEYRIPLRFFAGNQYDGRRKYDGSFRYGREGGVLYQLAAGMANRFKIPSGAAEAVRMGASLYLPLYYRPPVYYSGARHYDGSFRYRREQASVLRGGVKHIFSVKAAEKIEPAGVITKSKVCARFDGARTYDGSFTYHSFYRKEQMQ